MEAPGSLHVNLKNVFLSLREQVRSAGDDESTSASVILMSLLVSVTDKIVSTAERSFGTRALASKRLVMLFESTAFLRTLFPLSSPPAVVEDRCLHIGSKLTPSPEHIFVLLLLLPLTLRAVSLLQHDRRSVSSERFPSTLAVA